MKVEVSFKNNQMGVKASSAAIGLIGHDVTTQVAGNTELCRIVRLEQDIFVSGEPLPPFWFVSERDVNGQTTLIDVTGVTMRKVVGMRPVCECVAEISFGSVSQSSLRLDAAKAGDCFELKEDGGFYMIVNRPDKTQNGCVWAVPLKGGAGIALENDWKMSVWQNVSIKLNLESL